MNIFYKIANIFNKNYKYGRIYFISRNSYNKLSYDQMNKDTVISKNIVFKKRYDYVSCIDAPEEFDTEDILVFDKNFLDYKRGDYFIFSKEVDGHQEYKISKCIIDGKYFMPDIFDGNETPCIGYTMISKLVNRIRLN